MSKQCVLHHFGHDANTVVALPFLLPERIAELSGLRKKMIRNKPSEFSREEWAYLIQFLSEESLWRVVESTFGKYSPAELANRVSGKQRKLYRPRGQVGVWLPGNVSMLGPLTLVLSLLSGNRVALKASSGSTVYSKNLCGVFLNYILSQASSGLRQWCRDMLSVQVFDRTDAKNQQLAQNSKVRVFFGAEKGAMAVRNYATEAGAVDYPFVDKQSQAWIEISEVTDDLLANLVAVFTIYGQAGCTSPRRVVLVNANKNDTHDFGHRLQSVWTQKAKGTPEPHQASQNVLAFQWGRALGWDALYCGDKHGVILAGDSSLPDVDSPYALSVVASPEDKLVDCLPSNIQTVGTALDDAASTQWLQRVAGSSIVRFVPLAQMHHFSPTWDGYEFWRGMFTVVEVTA